MPILIAEDDAQIAGAPAGTVRGSRHALQGVGNGVGCSVIGGLRVSDAFPRQSTRA